jgi:hypothetical protein
MEDTAKITLALRFANTKANELSPPARLSRMVIFLLIASAALISQA